MSILPKKYSVVRGKHKSLLVFSLRIATPLSMDMFSWTRKEAVLYNGIIMCAIGFESILVFLAVKVASQRYPAS